jgi:ribosome biogenesis GTPase
MQGQIFKIHSDFYYANTDKGVFECKIRDVIKKQKAQIFVGDYVELEQINENSKQAFVAKVLPRTTFIPRPKVANITQVIIVSALKEPDLDFEQLNRYLCFCEYYKLNPVLCFNKNDLDGEEELIQQIKDIYTPLGYKLLFTSALEKNGIDEFKTILNNNITVLCGSSGVGKSSLINAIKPDLNIKTKSISEKTERGTHTTRHCEIINLDEISQIVDTPGFSQLRFDFLMPSEVTSLFRDFLELKNTQGDCKYTDCLHETENGCVIKQNIEKIASTRYSSYLQFVKEAKEYKKQVTYAGRKVETKAKFINNKQVTKISNKKRVESRKKTNQNIDKDL